MKKVNSKCPFVLRRFIGLMIFLFAGITAAQAEDWMKKPSKFYMSTQNNHVTFTVFLCDLDGNNTYAKSGGIYAVDNNGSRVWLMDIWYISEGSDENPFGKVRARYCIGESRAWFTNGYSPQRQKIEFNGKDFLIQKTGGNNHYCQPTIEFYYHASMAGKTWTFYYQYTHTNGEEYTMKLGSAYLSNTLGLSSFDTSKYTVERKGPDKIKFTVPAMPDDVNSELSDIHIHEGTYNVKFTYTKQDNKVVETNNTLKCEKGKTKTYDIDIPEEVGNPKRIDMQVTATDALKDARNYYWKNTRTYTKGEVFKTVPVPYGINTSYRQFDKMADLSWTVYSGNKNNFLNCTSYIYRTETDEQGVPLMQNSWSRRSKIDNANMNQSLGYSDNNVQQETYYKYRVVNVPTEWIGQDVSESSLNNPDNALLDKFGYVESELLATKLSMSIYDLQQDTAVVDKVKLLWGYSRVPTNASTVNFTVMRKTSEEGQWKEHGTVNGDAQPAAGVSLSYVDTDLPNPNVRYQYMVRLTLNNGKTVFDSDPIYAGLLSGTSLKTFEATKGTHDGTVRLTWTAKQVGTDPTAYEIFRRYIGTKDEFIKVNTTTGNTDRYTYEDNTVQPGYYYEYRIDAYNSGVKQNSLSDAGFCQARGVISGRVTFGTGSAVEDVRLSLQPSNTGDDNTVKGYSQRVDGASTGITWRADSTEIAKLFGNDFSVQMFVRPDQDINAGAVIAEIPGEGRISIGNQTADGYELVYDKLGENIVDLSTLTGNYTAKNNDVLTGTLAGNYKISIAEGATVRLKDVTINGVSVYRPGGSEFEFAGITCLGDATILLDGNNVVRGFFDEYPGIRVFSGNTLTIKGSGSLKANSNGNAAGIGGGWRMPCGNIVIQDGTIEAYGGIQSSGIGGGGLGSDCGTITIGKGVTRVYAEKGSNANNSIGKGVAGCGTVTIGSTVYWDGANYQNGGEAYLSPHLRRRRLWLWPGRIYQPLRQYTHRPETPQPHILPADHQQECRPTQHSGRHLQYCHQSRQVTTPVPLLRRRIHRHHCGAGLQGEFLRGARMEPCTDREGADNIRRPRAQRPRTGIDALLADG